MSRPSLGTFATEEEALRAVARDFGERGSVAPSKATEARSATAHSSTPTQLNPCLDLYLESWLQKRERNNRLERRSLSDLRDVITRYVIPALGHLRLEELTSETVGGWVRSLTHPDRADPWSRWRFIETDNPRPLSAKTGRKGLYALHRALRDSGLPTNPAKLDPDLLPRVDQPYLGDGDPEDRYPTMAAVGKYLAHVEPCDRPWGGPQVGAWYMAAHAGMRRAESR